MVRVVLQVEARLKELVLGGEVLRRVADVFEQELERGLSELPSSLQMENTYVPELPDGTGTDRNSSRGTRPPLALLIDVA